jgi:cytochrome b
MSAREHHVWDRSVRLFHWINFVCVVFLAFAGSAILFTGELGLSLEGNVRLKVVHVIVGYVFVLNLCWRIVWGFVGNHYARWRQVLPFGRGFSAELARYVRALTQRKEPHYLGHNPLGRVSVAVMLLVLTAQAVSGIVLAGTDVYMFPFGKAVAAHIAAPGIDPAHVKPHVPDAMSAQERAEMLSTVDPEAYAGMKRHLRKPAALIHDWGFYTLMFLVPLHIAAVVYKELGSRAGIVSAMFTGRKSGEFDDEFER